MCSDERRLARAAYTHGQLSEAVDLCERGIVRTMAQAEQDECWRLRILLSQCLCYLGDFAKSIGVFEAAAITEDVSVETRTRVLNQKGFGLSRSGNFAGAKGALDAAIHLAMESGSRELLAEIEINRSTLFFYLAKYDEVEKCARAALEIGVEQNVPMIEACACA